MPFDNKLGALVYHFITNDNSDIMTPPSVAENRKEQKNSF